MADQAGAGTATGRSLTPLIAGAAVVVLIGAMAFDTTIVAVGSDDDVRQNAFQPDSYGQAQFPDIRQSVTTRAVEAPTLADAILEDQTAAGETYGVGEGIGPVIPVTFTGTVGDGRAGVYQVAVEGVPDEITVRVQTGPAINGTDLRDATGNIQFGQFTNQIEYQDAGAAINDAMKAEVLSGIDTADLTGQTITVTGVFKLINPRNWFVTPVQMSVE